MSLVAVATAWHTPVDSETRQQQHSQFARSVTEGLCLIMSKYQHMCSARVPGKVGYFSEGMVCFTAAYPVSVCWLFIPQGVVSPMDVASVLQPPNKRLYMMLLATYGMMSNLDVGTESLRWMGDTRFTLGALWVSMVGLLQPGLLQSAHMICDYCHFWDCRGALLIKRGSHHDYEHVCHM